MSRLTRSAAIALCFIVGPTARVGIGAETRAAVQVERLPAEGSWEGLQFLQSDSSGRVFVLNPESLQVFEIRPTGALVSAAKLEMPTDPPLIRDAAMGRTPEDWLFLDFPYSVRWFEDGKVRRFPEVSWIPSAVAFRQGTPVVAVLPATASSGENVGGSGPKPGVPPLLLEAAKDEWRTAVANRDPPRIPTSDEDVKSFLTDLRGKGQARLTVDERGQVWVALQGAYRIRRHSTAGEQNLELRIGSGVVKMIERSPQDLEKLRASLAAQGHDVAIERLSRTAAPQVIYGLHAGRDGNLYVIHGLRAEGENEGVSLDRFDPSALRLDRVPLRAIDSTRVSMASGKDGLYLAAGNAQGGRWRITWESLDQAPWKAVNDALLDGQPLVPPAK